MSEGIDTHKQDDRAIEVGKVSHNLQNSLLLRTNDVSRSHQLSGLPELGSSTRCSHLGRRFAPLDERSRERIC